jgi:hypothetical protein
MEEMTSPEEIASLVEPDDDSTVEYTGCSDGGRYSYDYDSHVHAHRIPDSYTVVGFGSSWFALRQE